MRTHIRVVGTAYILVSIVRLLFALVFMLGSIFGSLASVSIPGIFVGVFTGVIGGVIMGAMAIFGLIAGFAFLSYRQWARYLLIFVSILGLFSWPIGTIFSVYALWVLFHRETQELFKAHERLG